MKRCDFKMNGDDLIIEDDAEGRFVWFEDVKALLDRICEATPDPAVHALVREALAQKEGEG